MSEKCATCGLEITDYSEPHCVRCGHLVGWPNYRKALSERPELIARYEASRRDLEARGLRSLLEKTEALAEACRPVVGMDCNACHALLMGGKYRNYHYRVEIGDRELASETNHGDRLMVNERIYPRYGRNLQYGLLSPDGAGLKSYGPIAVSWGVTPHYLATRATLLEENEFRFFESHNLGALKAVTPAGYRAVWDDRAKLVASKLAPHLDGSTGEADLPGLLMEQGVDRWSDVFVEVVIYAKGGIDSNDVTEVILLEALTDRASQRKWRELLEICQMRGIEVRLAK